MQKVGEDLDSMQEVGSIQEIAEVPDTDLEKGIFSGLEQDLCSQRIANTLSPTQAPAPNHWKRIVSMLRDGKLILKRDESEKGSVALDTDLEKGIFTGLEQDLCSQRTSNTLSPTQAPAPNHWQRIASMLWDGKLILKRDESEKGYVALDIVSPNDPRAALSFFFFSYGRSIVVDGETLVNLFELIVRLDRDYPRLLFQFHAFSLLLFFFFQ